MGEFHRRIANLGQRHNAHAESFFHSYPLTVISDYYSFILSPFLYLYVTYLHNQQKNCKNRNRKHLVMKSYTGKGSIFRAHRMQTDSSRRHNLYLCIPNMQKALSP